MAAQDAQVTCVAIIEDVKALDEIDAIAAVEGIDAFFIGRGDLTARDRRAVDDLAKTHAVVAPIMAAARAGMPIIMLSADRADAVAMAQLGASAFLVASDQLPEAGGAAGAQGLFGPAPVSRPTSQREPRNPSMKIADDRIALTHQLHALVVDYWHDVDTNWGRNAPDYYTEDGIFIGSSSSYKGREKIRAFYKWREDRGARTVVHSVHNFQAFFEGPDKALGALVPDALRG